MSELKVNSIKGVSATSAAISINNTDGTCTANITNNLSNRNLIINGAMQVAQRGSSSTTNGMQTVDRFAVYFQETDEAPTQAQVDVASGTTPYTLGFRKALKITNGNQTSGAGSNDMVTIYYQPEAQDIANSGWNYTSSSSYITLSFWVKSSVAQNFYGRVTSQDGSVYNYPFETGSLSADTWTKITKTIPGNSNLVVNSDNGVGLYIEWAPFQGTDRTASGVTLNQWGAWNSAARFPDNTSTWYTTNDATFEITGVQLEVSDHATDFEFKSFAQELALCMRYYEKTYPYGVALGGSSSYSGFINQSGSSNGTGTMVVPLEFGVEKRAAPTITAYNAGNGDSGTWYVLRNGANGNNSVTIDQISTRRARLYLGTGANWAVAVAEGHYEANAEL